MCECIKKINRENYIHADILHENTYFLYPITWNNGKGKIGKMGLLINFCPVCGEKLEIGVK
ncbi:MAG: hypothetical protein PHQ86_07680 [Dehalococcoidales bacterium]|nr:hypothetical protein [Dehalococcoidales bacterium]